MDVAMIDIQVNKIDEVTVIELIGEIDSTTAQDIQSRVLPLASESGKLLLDMTEVRYMSSAGLRFLLLLYRTINEVGGKIVVAGLHEELKDIMSMTGFLDFFTTVENRQAGLSSLQ